MHGLIGNFKSHPGQRDALVAILMENIDGMPGCRSYVVALDLTDADTVWITEVWDKETSHKASLQLPSVKSAISRAVPLIASFGERRITQPVDGSGLQPA